MTSDPPRGRRALVIGIDRYASDSVADLSGCVNDARLMRALLEDKYRIPAANVRFLADEDATRTRILEAFDGLIEETSPGDMVVVFYAGHGSRVADRDLDEADGHDSTIVPSDAVRWSQPDEFADHPEVLDITDDEIHAKLLRLGERTHNITMIFDCCHSGTISRGGDLVARAVPADRRPAQLLEPLRLSPEDRAALERSRQRSGSGWRSPQGHYVLIAGCRDTELSYEHEVGGHSPPVKHGALTWFLHQALLHAAPGATYRDVFDEVAVQVTSAARAKSASQHPQIEGAEHRLLFDTEEIEPLAFVKVADRQGAQVTLAGGAAHGLQVGSVWAVHPAGTREATEASQLGTLRVTRVGAVQSFADVEGDDAGAIAAGAWAVEVARDFGDRRLRVRMLGAGHEDPAAWTEMARRLDQERRLLERVEDGESVKVVLVAGEPPAELSGLPRLDGPHWVVVSEGGEFMMPPKPADERGAAQVVENLRLWSRYRFTLAIDNPGSRVAREVRVDLVRQAADGSWAPVVPADGESLPALTAGERIDIRLVHTGVEKIWVTGFDFRMTGEVVPILSGVWLHPSSPQNPWVSLTAGQGTTVSWEDGFPYGANPWVASPQEGIEVLKFFLTRQETDLDVSQRAASRGGTSPLAELLASPAAASRGLTLVPADDWGTVSVGFVLRAPEEIAAEPVVEAARVQAEAAPEPERAERPTSGASDTTTAAGPSPSTASPRRQNGATSPSAFPPSDSPAGRLQALMAEHGFVSADRFPVESGTGSRGAPIEYVAPDAEEGWSELLLTTDDRGLVRWHLPEPGLSSARGADPAAEGTRGRRYRIAAPPPAAVPEDARGADGRDARGAVGALAGKLLVDRVLFPLAEPLIGNAVARWETRRRPGRWMWMDADGDAATVRPVQAEEWPVLGEGPTLVLLHGVFGGATRTVRDLTPAFLQEVAGRYARRVIAFEHATLSQDPDQTVDAMVASLPAGLRLDVDVLGHSRGGLVGRALAARGRASEAPLSVRRLVCAGSPDGGTPLADLAHLETLLSVLTNLLALADPTELGGTVLELMKRLAVGGLGELRGIQAMAPGSAFLSGLTPLPPSVEWYGLASDITSATRPGILRTLLDRQIGDLFGGANDLVVPAASVGAAAAESWTLRGGEAVSHLGYLSRPEARGRIATWLLRDGAPLQVTTAPTAGSAETGSPVPAAPAPDDAAPEPPRVERDDPPAAADAVERPVSTLQTRPPRPPGPRPLRPPRAPGRPRSP